MVTAALSSSNKSRQLARRIFFSFVPSGRRSLILSDVLPFFASREAAGDAFAVLDRDGKLPRVTWTLCSTQIPPIRKRRRRIGRNRIGLLRNPSRTFGFGVVDERLRLGRWPPRFYPV